MPTAEWSLNDDVGPSVVASLPQNILLVIFGKCAPNSTVWNLPRSLLSFSQVCRRWREVALNDPRLWTDIPFRSSALARMMLERAQDAPLKICAGLDSKANYQNDLVEEALRRHANVKTLYLKNVQHVLQSQISQITGPMPILTELTLQTSEAVTDACILRSNGLEKFEAPQLRSLRLVHCVLPWTSKCISNLTSLSIEHGGKFATMTDIVDVLGKNRFLKTLTLNNAIQPAGAEVSRDHHHKVPLEKLVSMDLSETIEVTNTLLSHLTLPSMLSWTIGIVEPCRSTTAVVALLDFCRARLTIPEGKTARFLQLEGPRHLSRLTLCADEYDRESDGITRVMSSEPEPTEVHFTVSLQLADGVYEGVLELGVVPWFSLEHLESCSLAISDPRDCDQIWERMSALPKLQKILAEGTPIEGFLELFEAEHTDESHLFPALEILLLQEIYLCKIDENLRMTPLRRLAIILKMLNDCGRPIREVQLDQCQVQSSPKKVFRNFGVAGWAYYSEVVGQDDNDIEYEYDEFIEDLAPSWVTEPGQSYSDY